MPGLTLISGPAIEPITLVEARAQLRLDATGSPLTHPDDALVTTLIEAVRRNLDGADGRLARALITQTWQYTLDEFPVNQIRIPLPPLQSIVSIKYDDLNAVEQTVSAANYVVDTTSRSGWVMPVTGFSWPATFDSINTVRIQFKAGYGDTAADVPASIRQAMLLMIEALYEGKPFPGAVDALLTAYEIFVIV